MLEVGSAAQRANRPRTKSEAAVAWAAPSEVSSLRTQSAMVEVIKYRSLLDLRFLAQLEVDVVSGRVRFRRSIIDVSLEVLFKQLSP